jgi:hypothetical protein
LNPDETPEERNARLRAQMDEDHRQRKNEARREANKEKIEARRVEKQRRMTTKDALAHLKPLELRFVKVLAAQPKMNRTQALLQAGFKPREGKEHDTCRYADQMWNRPIVRAALYQITSQALDMATLETSQILRETASIALTPDHMIKGRITYREKIEALKLLGGFYELLNRTTTVKHEHSLVGLIVSSARRQHEQLTQEVGHVIEHSSETQEPAAIAAGGRGSADPVED